MKHWKIFSIVSSITILFLFVPFRISKGCAYPDDAGDYTFLYPKLMEQKTAFFPYITLDAYPKQHLSDTEARRFQKQKNLEEWSSFACETEELEDIEAIVYTSTIEDLQSLRRAAKKGNVPSKWASNSFASGLVKNKCTDTYDYLMFAKMCEPHAISGSRWDADRPFNSDVQELIDMGKKMLSRTDNHFLRLRYMYQIVRLAHYADDYDYALELYKELDYKVDKVPSIIQWWLLGHKAGCLKRLGKNVESAYLFSKVFKNSPSKREQVFRSFYIENDAEWEACLKMCESDEERATLYVMRAMDSNSRTVEEMENIYRLSPASEDLIPLLIKEIQNIEPYFTGTEFKRSAYATKPDKIADKRLLKLEAFVHKVIGEGKVKDKARWRLAQGYIEYLTGDLYAARQSFDIAKPLVKENENLEKQLDIFELLLKIHSFESMNPTTEEEVLDIVKNNDYYQSIYDFQPFLFERIAALYEKQGAVGKAFLSLHDLSDLQRNPEPEILNDLIALAENKNRDRFETYLLKNKLGEDFASSLYEIKGTMHLSKYELPEALRALNKVSPSMIGARKYNPFHLPIKDCIHCKMTTDTNSIIVNKVELVEKLLDYEYKAKTDMENAASYYYLLGAAFYNMSYYGNEHEILDTFRHSWHWQTSPEKMQEEIKKEKKAGYFGDIDYTDVSKALFFFDKARELANNNELAARASFMAAKCQLAQFYQDPKMGFDPWENDMPKLPPKYRNYYDLLIKKYSETDFFEEIIEECLYFGAYVEKN